MIPDASEWIDADGSSPRPCKRGDTRTQGLAPEQHRAQLAKLKEQDPEFYEFLQKNDRALLEFADDEEEADTADDDVAAAATVRASGKKRLFLGIHAVSDSRTFRIAGRVY